MFERVGGFDYLSIQPMRLLQLDTLDSIQIGRARRFDIRFKLKIVGTSMGWNCTRLNPAS